MLNISSCPCLAGGESTVVDHTEGEGESERETERERETLRERQRQRKGRM